MLKKSIIPSLHPLPIGERERARRRERRLSFGNSFIGHQKGKAK